MTSTFSTGTKRRNSPAWCKPGMYTGIPPTTNDRPTGLNVYVHWFDDVGTDPVEITTTFHLYRNDANNGWNGSSSPTHPRLIVTVTDRPDVTRYDVKIELDIWGWVTESWTFYDVSSDFRPPWGTALTAKIWAPYHQLVTFQILG